jgi:hypothetical protein
MKETSNRDALKYGKDLPALVGCDCFLSLACNSLKIHLGKREKGGSYFWIDPPWEFRIGDKIVQTADACPHHAEEDYEVRFRSWCDLNPISEGVIEDIQTDSNSSLSILIKGGYSIHVPTEYYPDPDDEPMHYDHWYLRMRFPHPNPPKR